MSKFTMKQSSEEGEILCSVLAELKCLGVKVPKIKKYKSNIPKQDKILCEMDCKIFGVSLYCQEKVYIEDFYLPKFIVESTNYLRRFMSKEIGLFRKAGSVVRQRKLRAHLETGGTLENSEPNDVASLIKQWLRELPEPLIPPYVHDLYLRCQNLENEESRISGILLCCHLLPPDNLYTLRHLLEFLADIAAYREENKMGTHNLAVVMAPNIFVLSRDCIDKFCNNRVQNFTSVIELLIENVHKIGEASLFLSTHLAEVDMPRCTNFDLSHDGLDYSPSKSRKKRSGPVQDLFSGIRKLVGQNSISTISKKSNLEDKAMSVPLESESKQPANKRKAEPYQPMSSIKKPATTSAFIQNVTHSFTPTNDQNIFGSVKGKSNSSHSRRRSFGLLRRKKKRPKSSKRGTSGETSTYDNSKCSTPHLVKDEISGLDQKVQPVGAFSPLLSVDIKSLSNIFARKSVSDCHLQTAIKNPKGPQSSSTSRLSLPLVYSSPVKCTSGLLPCKNVKQNLGNSLQISCGPKENYSRKSADSVSETYLSFENLENSFDLLRENLHTPCSFSENSLSKSVGSFSENYLSCESLENSLDMLSENPHAPCASNENSLLKSVDSASERDLSSVKSNLVDNITTIDSNSKACENENIYEFENNLNCGLKESNSCEENKKSKKCSPVPVNRDEEIKSLKESTPEMKFNPKTKSDMLAVQNIQENEYIRRKCSIKRQGAFIIKSNSNIKEKDAVRKQVSDSSVYMRKKSNDLSKSNLKRETRKGSLTKSNLNSESPFDSVDKDLSIDVTQPIHPNFPIITINIEEMKDSHCNENSPFSETSIELKRKKRQKALYNSDTKLSKLKKNSEVLRTSSFPEQQRKLRVANSLSSRKSDLIESKENVPSECEAEHKSTTYDANEGSPEKWQSTRFESLPVEKETDNKRDSIVMIIKNNAGHVLEKVHSYDQRIQNISSSTPTTRRRSSGNSRCDSSDTKALQKNVPGKTQSPKSRSKKSMPIVPKCIFSDSPKSYPLKELTNISNNDNVSFGYSPSTSFENSKDSFVREMRNPSRSSQKVKEKRNSYSGHTPYKIAKVFRSESSPLFSDKHLRRKKIEYYLSKNKFDDRNPVSPFDKSCRSPAYKTRSVISIEKLPPDCFTDEWQCEV